MSLTSCGFIFGDDEYVIFKYTINNTDSEKLDYSLAGYEMTGYQDNYYLGTASYSLDDKVDGYSNIYNIDSVEVGMSANIYVAFDKLGTSGSRYMVYDDGYIANKVRGKVFVK